MSRSARSNASSSHLFKLSNRVKFFLENEKSTSSIQIVPEPFNPKNNRTYRVLSGMSPSEKGNLWLIPRALIHPRLSIFQKPENGNALNSLSNTFFSPG